MFPGRSSNRAKTLGRLPLQHGKCHRGSLQIWANQPISPLTEASVSLLTASDSALCFACAVDVCIKRTFSEGQGAGLTSGGDGGSGGRPAASAPQLSRQGGAIPEQARQAVTA
jgi:hypothetical protein